MAPRGRSRSRSRSRSRERKERKERRKREKERDAEDQRAAARRAAPAPAAAPARRRAGREGGAAPRGDRGRARAREAAARGARRRRGREVARRRRRRGGALDAEAWVKRSRAAPALAKLEAERRSRLLFEQDRSDYDAGDLEGLGVAARTAAVGRGEELILTLADEQILDYDEGKHGKLVGLRKGSGARSRRSRARALRSRKNLEGDEAAAAVATTVKAEPRAEGDAPADADALVFTSTTEFTARLHARLEERAAENAEASAEAAADALAAAGGAAVKAEAGELPPDESDSDAMSDSDDESLAAAEAEDRGDLIDFLHKQPLARDGMAATMGLLRQTGDVQIKHVEQKVGRARDQTIFEDGTEDDPAAPPDPSLQFKPIKLEYRDADGRLLTRKEAFRQMCHKFHGKGPGKKKQEKFAAREAERQRSIKMSAGAGSLSILQHAQARTGQAFVPINNQTAYAAMGQPKEKSKSKKKKKKAKGH
ncbi:U4/U6.U5 tri-snRNP-associated protein [Aureococcus anophagefferens]|uniref:U4/U6.U5 tri-snRNP-associated protein n=2 Tax=Aureococcus anophagefferens TaxID=44056 RepID=A0ABR1FN89_AURAN